MIQELALSGAIAGGYGYGYGYSNDEVDAQHMAELDQVCVGAIIPLSVPLFS